MKPWIFIATFVVAAILSCREVCFFVSVIFLPILKKKFLSLMFIEHFSLSCPFEIVNVFMLR